MTRYRTTLYSIPKTSNVFPDFAFTHSPFTYATLSFSNDGSLSFGTLWESVMVDAALVIRVGKVDG